MLLAAQSGFAADTEFTKQALGAARAIKDGKNDEALATLDRLLKRYPKAADLDLVYWLTCKAYTAEANYDAAITYCSAAILRNQRNANFIADRGKAYFLRGDAAKARGDLDIAAAMNTDKPFVYGMLARLYWDAGETVKAKIEVAKALRLNAREENALQVRLAARHAPAQTQQDIAVRPMPRVPPPAAAIATSGTSAPAKPAQPLRTAALLEAVPPQKAAEAKDGQSDNKTGGAASALPAGAPPWWKNTPPVPAYDASRQQRPDMTVNCARTRVPAEKLICSDADLHRQDGEMVRLFRRVQQIAADEAAMEADQRDWIEGGRNACRSRSCLRASFANRRLELKLWLDD